MENKLIQAVKKMFIDKHDYFELGSSQSDLIESHVIKTIKEVLKGDK
jgi:hemoglobin-like flavoprotein